MRRATSGAVGDAPFGSACGTVRPATRPRAAREVRVLVVSGGETRIVPQRSFASLFDRGDVVVVNDAATLPASIRARTAGDEEVEIRLASGARGSSVLRFDAVLFGAGDWHTPTEDRPTPPYVNPGDLLTFLAPRRARRLALTDVSVGEGAGAIRIVSVSEISPRLVRIELPSWDALYRAGRPIQYAHVPDALALWDVQNAYASRPWAVEMPSAGRVVTGEVVEALRARGVVVATLTHAAGLSSTGDPAIDARLPLPERYEVPESTLSAVRAARKAGGRVLAVGTSVARAPESAARGPRAGITDLRIGPATKRKVVDGIVTGVHDAGTSHYELLGAFASDATLRVAMEHAERASLLGHEFGDAMLLWGEGVESHGVDRA